MRVNHTGSSPVQGNEAPAAKQTGHANQTQETKRPDRGGRSSETTRSDTSSAAKADISTKSKEFAQAKSVASAAPETRDERIAELKQRIMNGDYKVSSEKIADRMVDEHLRSGIG